MDIRAELRDLMNSKNYSLAFVSTATGIAKSSISMWLNGNYKGDNAKLTILFNVNKNAPATMNFQLLIFQ